MPKILQFVAFSGLWAEVVGWVCWGKNGLWTNGISSADENYFVRS